MRPKTETAWILLVLLLTFLVYAPSLANDFAMDDTSLAKSTTRQGELDPVIGELHGPVFYFGNLYWAGTRSYDELYRPATIYSYALTYHGLSKPFLPPEWEAFPQHLVNLCLHVLATFLVWRLVLVFLRGSQTASLSAILTAGLFGLHAIHSEVVAGIVGRAELLGFCFGALGLLAYLRGRAAVGLRCWLWYLLFCLFFLLAYCSKENALAWAPFLLCFLAARKGNGLRPQLLPLLVGLALPLLVYFCLRGFALENHPGQVLPTDHVVNPLVHATWASRLPSAVKIWGYGLCKCFFPYPLVCVYGLGVFELVDSPLDPGFLVAFLILLGFLVSGLLLRKRAPLLFLAMTLFLGFGFLVSNIPFPIGTIFAERLYYTPSLGICLLPAVFLGRLGLRGRRVLISALLCWVMGSSAVILVRNPVWKNDESLFLHDVELQPHSADMQDKAAEVYAAMKPPQMEKAKVHVDRALEIYPEFPAALVKLAAWHGQRGEREAALQAYEKALASPYLREDEIKAQALFGKGYVLVTNNEVEAGLEAFWASLQVDDRRAQAYVLFVDYALGRSQWNQKVEQLLIKGRRLFPENAVMAVQRGRFLYQLGVKDRAQAEVVLREFEFGLERLPASMRWLPQFIKAETERAACLVMLGRRRQAEELFDALLASPDLSAARKESVRQEKVRVLR